MAEASSDNFIIPTVDIAPFLANPDSKEADDVVHRIRNASRTSGFFQITGHGVSRHLQDAVFQSAKHFFALPLEEKKRYAASPGRGYERIGEQNLEPGTKPDLKEGYFIGRNDPSRKPPFRNYEHPNIWPSSSIPDAHFKDPLLAYHAAMTSLAEQVLAILARGLADLDTTLLQHFCKDPVAALRLLHYPPHPVSEDSALRGIGAHTDFGAITLLLQDGETAGLQVFNKNTGSWIGVPPVRDAYVVNIGDILHYWSAGEYSSTLHRVMNTSGKDRYSIPFFFDGNLDFVLAPLRGGGARAGDASVHALDSITVEQQMNRRYQASYADTSLLAGS